MPVCVPGFFYYRHHMVTVCDEFAVSRWDIAIRLERQQIHSYIISSYLVTSGIFNYLSISSFATIPIIWCIIS